MDKICSLIMNKLKLNKYPIIIYSVFKHNTTKRYKTVWWGEEFFLYRIYLQRISIDNSFYIWFYHAQMINQMKPQSNLDFKNM